MANVVIRKGVKGDYPYIIKLINELMTFNKKPQGSALTIKDLEADGLGELKFFKILVAEADNAAGKMIIGYIIYYLIYSSFKGPCIYMEDLFVTKESRQRGVGGLLQKELVKIGLEVGCKRLDFVAANWNDQGIKFYKKHGAVNITVDGNWLYYRLQKEKMIKLADNPKIKTILSVRENNGSKDMVDVVIRKGEKRDCPGILKNLIELSHFEKNPQGVTVTVKDLEEDGFGDNKLYRAYVAEADTAEGKRIVGFAVYFFGYSSYVGRSSFLDDIYVNENFRHLGLGVALWKAVIQDVLENGCNELEFIVFKWNTPAIKFYKNHGAVDLSQTDGWEFYRYEVDAMKKIMGT